MNEVYHECVKIQKTTAIVYKVNDKEVARTSSIDSSKLYLGENFFTREEANNLIAVLNEWLDDSREYPLES